MQDGAEISSVVLTPNDAHLVTVSRALMIHVYALPDMALVRTIGRAHDAPVALMAVDPTSSLLALGGTDGCVKVYDLARGYVTHVFPGHGGVISALCWQVQTVKNRRAVHLYTGCVDGKVRMWDLQGGAKAAAKPVAVLSAHAGVVRAIAVAPDGQTLVSRARDQTLVFYAWPDARWARQEIRVVGERIEAAGFVARDVLYTAGAHGMVRLWRVSEDAPLAAQAAALEDAADAEDELSGLTDAHYARAANVVVAATAAQDLAFVRVDAAAPALALVRQLVGYNDEIVDVAVLQRGEEGAGAHLAVASNNRLVRIYRLDADDHDAVLLPGHGDMVLSVDASADGRWLASASRDRTARIWAPHGAREWRAAAVCEGHAESVGCVAFARGAGVPPFMVTASQDRTVKVWDLSGLGGEAVRPASLVTRKIHDKDINAVDVAPNNALLLSASQDRTAKVFRLEYTPPSKGNGHRAAAALRPLATCRGHKRGVWSCQFSPAEQAFATGSGDQTVRLWSLKDFSCVRVFEGHTGSVLRVRFLPGGQQLASSASDGLVKVWNVKDEACATTIDAADDKIWTLAVRRAPGRALQLISGAADSTIACWDDATAAVHEAQAAAAQAAVEREQAFANLVLLKDYKNAIALALQLDQPRRLLALFAQVAAARPDGDAVRSIDQLFARALGTPVPDASVTGLAAVDEIVAALPQPQLVQLLGYIRDWNTSARTAPTAQLLLHAVVRLHRPATLLGAYAKSDKPGSLSAVLDALVPYTERHYARADRMLVESAMLEYTLHAMDAVLGGDLGAGLDAGPGVGLEAAPREDLGGGAGDASRDAPCDDPGEGAEAMHSD